MKVKTKINAFVTKKCLEFGKKIVDNYFEGFTGLLDEIRNYEQYVYRVARHSLAETKENIKTYFWYKFDFVDFKYTEIPKYKIMANKSDKSILVEKLIHIFDYIQLKTPNRELDILVSSPEELLTVLDSVTSNEAHNKIIDEFRTCCIQNIDKSKYIDFWFYLALMQKDTLIDFILENEFDVFTNIDLLAEYIDISNPNQNLSDIFRVDKKLALLLHELNAYLENNKKPKDKNEKDDCLTVQKMIDVIYNELEKRMKIYKNYKKNERKMQRKQAFNEKKDSIKQLFENIIKK